MSRSPDYSSDGWSVADVVAGFERDGFTGNFGARPAGLVVCFACRAEHPADEVELHELQRVEGASDPADMAAVSALVCPACGTRGTVVLAGPEASAEDADVLRLLEDRRDATGNDATSASA